MMKNIFFIVLLSMGIILAVFVKIPQTNNTHINSIITLSPSHSPTLDFLGLGDKIIAISSYDKNTNHQHKIKIGGGIHFYEEELLALNPNLVIIGDIQRNSESVEFLEKKGIKTLTIKTTSFQDIYQSLLDLQKLFPNIVSNNLINNYYQQWVQIQNNPVTTRRTAFILLSIDPIYTISTNNYLNELYYYSGWDNIISTKTEYPIINEEQLLSLPQPDDLIITANLTNEWTSVNKIKDLIKAKNIVIISNQQISLPSPYLLDITKELRLLQSSLY